MGRQIRIGIREVKALKPNSTLWDSVVRGFGIRRQRSEAVSYILFYRTRNGRQRVFTIGRHGAPWIPDSARDKARRLLGDVASGADPANEKAKGRNAKTVGELCDHYLMDAEAGRLLTRRKVAKKASTLATDRGRVERHIKPILGRLPVADVTRADVESFMHDVANGATASRVKTKPRGIAIVTGGKGTATRTVGLLGAIFSYAVQRGMRSDNPVRGVIRFADGRRERRLSEAEYRQLGTALRNSETAYPFAVAAARFLALTGWRRGEVLGLKWDAVDIQRRTARLLDTKTGSSLRPLATRACNLATDLPHVSEFVFAPAKGKGAMTGFPKLWHRIAQLGGLDKDVTPHVLRHSFASIAAELGFSESTIGAMIGHKGHTITSRYVHHADAVLVAAADRVSRRIAELMGDGSAEGEVVELASVRAA